MLCGMLLRTSPEQILRLPRVTVTCPHGFSWLKLCNHGSYEWQEGCTNRVQVSKLISAGFIRKCICSEIRVFLVKFSEPMELCLRPTAINDAAPAHW